MMQIQRLARTGCSPLILLLLTLGACRTGPPPETKTNPANPATTTQPVTGSAPDSKAVAERPLFEGRIENISIYPVPNRREDLAVSIVINITNAGVPSIAQGWTLEVTSPGRRFPTTMEPVHVNGLVEMPGSNNVKVDLGKEDLVIKSAQAPVAKGARLNGILTFVLPKTAENEVSNNNTGLVIHFKDPQGNSYQTPRSVIGRKATPP